MSQPGTTRLISCIITCYNNKNTIVCAVNSYLAQTYSQKELILIDDCSSDNSADFLRDQIKEIGRDDISLIISDANLGQSSAINRAAKIARGDYLAFLDGDDYWLPSHLDSQVAYLEQKDVDAVASAYYINNGRDIALSNTRKIALNEYPVDYLLSGGKFSTSTILVKKEKFRHVLFNEVLRRHTDYDFYLRFSSKYKTDVNLARTVVVNWPLYTPRKRHFESHLKFIETYRQQTSSVCTYNYLRELLIESVRHKAPKPIKKELARRLTFYRKHMPLTIRLLYQFPSLLFVYARIKGDI